jgi:hypothetical protein
MMAVATSASIPQTAPNQPYSPFMLGLCMHRAHGINAFRKNMRVIRTGYGGCERTSRGTDAGMSTTRHSGRTSEHETGCVGKGENRSVHVVVICAFLREAGTASNLLTSYPVNDIDKEHHSLRTNRASTGYYPAGPGIQSRQSCLASR